MPEHEQELPPDPPIGLSDNPSDSEPLEIDNLVEVKSVPAKNSLYNGKRVQPDLAVGVISLAKQGVPSREIAKQLHMDYRTVEGVIANRDHSADVARYLLLENAQQFVRDWIVASKKAATRGKHTAAKDALLHSKVIEPIAEPQSQTAIQIVIGQPASPVLPTNVTTQSNSPLDSE